MTLFTKSIFSDEPARGWLPWGVLAPILTFFMFNLALIGVILGILRPLGYVDESLDPVGPIGLAMMLFFAFGLAGAVFAAWVKFVEKRSLASVGLQGRKALKTFLGGHLIGVLLMSGTVLGIWAFGGYTVGDIAPALTSPIGLFHIGLLLVGFALQSSVEEFVFRGWLLSVLTRKFNLLAAVIVSSLLFTLMHFNPASPPQDHVMTMLFSFFACAWVIRTSNVWGAMGWHSGWNWIGATGFEVPITGLKSDTPALFVQLTPSGSDFLTGGKIGPEGSIICLTLLAVATLYVWFKPNKISVEVQQVHAAS